LPLARGQVSRNRNSSPTDNVGRCVIYPRCHRNYSYRYDSSASVSAGDRKRLVSLLSRHKIARTFYFSKRGVMNNKYRLSRCCRLTRYADRYKQYKRVRNTAIVIPIINYHRGLRGIKSYRKSGSKIIAGKGKRRDSRELRQYHRMEM